MSGGAPASPAPTAPVYTDPVNGMTFTDVVDPFGRAGASSSGAAALNAEIASRIAKDQATSDANKEIAAQIQGQNENQFNSDYGAGLTKATGDVNQYFADNGYDPGKFYNQINSGILRAAGGIQDPATGNTTSAVPSYASTVSAALPATLGAQILQQINSGVRSKATNQISSEFAPTYAEDNISNDWLAPAASSVLDAQFNPLSDQLLNSQKRGTLNDVGYGAALKALTHAKTAASSTVNNLGTNILNNDRTGINDYITGAKNDAAGLNASTADSFDPGKYLAGASSRVNQYRDNFSGDLTNAVGNTQFSSLGDLLNAGGVVQGANDPTATNPTAGGPGAGGGGISDAFIAQQALANQKRGLGSSGAF